MFSPRGARLLLGFLIVFKLAISAYNVAAYDQTPPDWEAHAERVMRGEASPKSCPDAPHLYYLTARPYVELQKLLGAPTPEASDLAEYLRWTNLAFLGVFYWCWVFCIFPRVAGNYRAATAASLTLLAIPSYQRLTASAQPENALVCLSTVCMAAWLWLRWGHPPRAPGDAAGRWRRVAAMVVLGCATILAAFTRPFGLVPAAVFFGALLVELGRGRRLLSRGFLGAAVPALALAAALAGTWQGYPRSGPEPESLGANAKAKGRGAPRHASPEPKLDLATFRLSALLSTPNRRMREELPPPSTRVQPGSPKPSRKTPPVSKPRQTANTNTSSYFTLLYSEIWGDHWLSFSGRRQTDNKIWPKRILFVVALPLLPLLAIRFGHGTWRTIRQFRPRLGRGLEALLVLAFCLVGSYLYLSWQLGEGMQASRGASVQFRSFAFLVPFVIATCSVPRIGKLRFNLWLAYLLTLFMAAFSLAVFWSGAE